MNDNCYRYTISFLPTDHELISFVENKRKTNSFSSYVRNLIRKDMGQATLEEEQFEGMYQYLLKRLQNSEKIILTENTLKPFVEDADKDLILNIF